MIQAHEIKVGNRFIRELHNSHGLEYDHDFVLTEEWMGKLFGDNTSIALQDLFPIPLSSEILKTIECFEKDTTSQFGGYLFDIGGDEKIRIVFDKIIGWNWPLYGNTPIPVNNLHELQNLIYSLIKTELNYQQK